MGQGASQTVISALNSTVDGQFSVKLRTGVNGQTTGAGVGGQGLGSIDNARGSVSNLTVTIRDNNTGGLSTVDAKGS